VTALEASTSATVGTGEQVRIDTAGAVQLHGAAAPRMAAAVDRHHPRGFVLTGPAVQSPATRAASHSCSRPASRRVRRRRRAAPVRSSAWSQPSAKGALAIKFVHDTWARM